MLWWSAVQHNEPIEIQYDIVRIKIVATEWGTVVRIWDNDIDKNMVGVYEELQKDFNVK